MSRSGAMAIGQIISEGQTTVQPKTVTRETDWVKLTPPPPPVTNEPIKVNASVYKQGTAPTKLRMSIGEDTGLSSGFVTGITFEAYIKHDQEGTRIRLKIDDDGEFEVRDKVSGKKHFYGIDIGHVVGLPDSKIMSTPVEFEQVDEETLVVTLPKSFFPYGGGRLPPAPRK